MPLCKVSVIAGPDQPLDRPLIACLLKVVGDEISLSRLRFYQRFSDLAVEKATLREPDGVVEHVSYQCVPDTQLHTTVLLDYPCHQTFFDDNWQFLIINPGNLLPELECDFLPDERSDFQGTAR